MKVKEGFRMRTMLGEHIVVAEGLKNINFNKMISLNASAAYLWESVADKEFTVETLKDLLLEKYEVAPEVAAADAEKVARAWIDAGIVEE
ncbi:MAG: PqqD family protein [Bacteroidales bacterium]|nr:PqqD family protein [Bacteroidales bacterium]MBP5635857.1 PqqD family protein [Bacteroidales bacterium]